MSGIADSLIAAILYATGAKIWRNLNDPLANAIDKTVVYFSKEKGIEIKRDRFEALLSGDVGKDAINGFRAGNKFIEGDELSRNAK